MKNVYYSSENGIEFEDLPIAYYEFSNKSQLRAENLSPHWQAMYELIYVFEGEVIFYVDGAAIKASAKDAIIISPNQTHSVQKALSPAYRFVCIIIGSLIFSSSFGQLINRKYLKPQKNETILFPNYLDHLSVHTSKYAKVIESIAISLETKDWGYELYVQMMILRLLYSLLTAGDYTCSSESNSNYPSNVQQLLITINQNFDQNINFTVIAKEANISYAHLSREFKRIIGKSPQVYLNDLRLEHSKMLLRKNADMSMTEAAEESGFQDMSYFSKCFREKYKMTPSEFHKTAAQIADNVPGKE